jgi:DNA-directed RNA polymerase specialized sigma24 family protein
MLGSITEADDAVQDTWVRMSRAETSEVANLGGWLTTIVARVCLNMLRSRNVRREEPPDVHLPDRDEVLDETVAWLATISPKLALVGTDRQGREAV